MTAIREAAEPRPSWREASRTESVDVWNEVPLVPQTTGMSCWAAAASMLIGWRDAVPVDPEEVARAAGHWESFRDGMRPGSVPDLARIWGLRAEPAPQWTPEWLARRLAEVGPLWIGEASPGLHAVVLVGLRGDGTEDGTEVLVNDPWPVGRGERYRLPFRELVQRVRAAASTAGPHVRVLHTDGRGRGARRHVHVQESTMSETLSYGANALQVTVAAGSATLDAHGRGQPLADHGTAGPSLYLRWNGFTAPDDAAVDVVLYFHGYSDHGPDVVLQHKIRSEIRAHTDPALGGRTAPTLLIVPRGRATRTTAEQQAAGLPQFAYAFPAVASEHGVRRLVNHALEQFARAAHLPRAPRVARRIYVGHSGGGSPVGAILTNHGSWQDADPDEVWLFDATYGDGAGVISWIGTPARRPADRRLRVFHQRRSNGSFTRTGTGAEAIARHVAAHVPAEHRGRFLVQSVALQHGEIPNRLFLPVLRNPAVVVDPSGQASAQAVEEEEEARFGAPLGLFERYPPGAFDERPQTRGFDLPTYGDPIGPYRPPGGATRQRGRHHLRCGPVDVVDATRLPEPTTDGDAAIDAAAQAAAVPSGARSGLRIPALRTFAQAVGAPMLTELFTRLRWRGEDVARGGPPPQGADVGRLVPRLLLHLIGHFRELARSAPSDVEAHVLESAGWAYAERLRDAVSSGSRWWLPPRPGWAAPISASAVVTAPVRQVLTRDGVMSDRNPAAAFAAAFTTWRDGLPGRFWREETRGSDPWKLFYPSLVTIPAPDPGIGAAIAAVDALWERRRAEVDAQHPPIGATITAEGLRNAAALRQDAEAYGAQVPTAPARLHGMRLVHAFPARDGARAYTSLAVLRELAPQYDALFAALAELGWNDLLYACAGSHVFRGIRQRFAAPLPGRGSVFPVDHPDTAPLVEQHWTADQKERLRRVIAAGRNRSRHAGGEAIDFNVEENGQTVAGRPFGSMDPRVTAAFEAFGFRWGGCFGRASDPMHFEWAGRAPAVAHLFLDEPVYGDPLYRQRSQVFLAAGTGRAVAGVRVGTGAAAVDYLAVDSRGRLVDLTAARLGEVLPSRTAVYRMQQATLTAVAGTPGAFTVTFTGPKLAMCDDGRPLLERGPRRWKWIDLVGVPFGAGSRIDFTDGQRFVWMRFRYSDERAATPRFVPAKATTGDVAARRAEFATEAARLPAGAERTSVDARLSVMAATSVVEGTFSSHAFPGDSHASLGISQWAMPRTGVDAGSLGRFLRRLEERAGALGGLYARAWAQCTGAGLSVNASGNRISVNGVVATGNQVDAALGPQMNRADLRTYQLVAANDEVDTYVGTAPSTGYRAAEVLGPGQSVSASRATLTRAGHTVKVDAPAAVGRLGAVFTSNRAVASAVLLGVNRPAYVAQALWHALQTSADPRAELEAQLDVVVRALAAAGIAEPRGGYTRTQVTAAGAGAIAAYDQLQRLLWPAVVLPAGGEAELLARFEVAAIAIYPARDARRFLREGRFATAALLL